MNDDFLVVSDIDAWAEMLLVHTAAIEVVDGAVFAAVGLTNDLDGCCGVLLQGAEGEVGGFVVFGGCSIFEVLACSDVPQRPALALDILDVPDSTIGDIIASLFVQAVDKTAVASDSL